MDASLDTNVIIHLYNANLQNILFSRFEKLKVYEFIRTQELERHADRGVLKLFDDDIKNGKIVLISDGYLKDIGMLVVFQSHVRDAKILYNGTDLGEVYAISIAKTLGCLCLVTDDIKEYGPHFTLMRTPDSEVLPFAFYELLFLDYLENLITGEKLIEYFNQISSTSGLKMNCASKLNSFMKRFWSSPYSEAEKAWMKEFCSAHTIDAKDRIRNLKFDLLAKNM